MRTTIQKCTCKHEYQDKKHGQGKRVMNVTKDGMWRCTVCDKVKPKEK